MSRQATKIFSIALLLVSIFQLYSAKQTQLILKFEDAINLRTAKFIQPECQSELKIQQTLHQLDEWVQITSSIDSLRQYKQSLKDLVNMIEESRSYIEGKETQQSFEEAPVPSESAELQLTTEIQNPNSDLTLDELAEKLSRIEKIQTYLDTLKEEGFEDYDNHEKVITSMNTFIQDIDKLEEKEDELNMNRFKLIEKADEIQQIYNQCYANEEQEQEQKVEEEGLAEADQQLQIQKLSEIEEVVIQESSSIDSLDTEEEQINKTIYENDILAEQNDIIISNVATELVSSDIDLTQTNLTEEINQQEEHLLDSQAEDNNDYNQVEEEQGQEEEESGIFVQSSYKNSHLRSMKSEN